MQLYNSDYQKFKEHVRNKILICYGAGKMLEEMLEEMPEICAVCKLMIIVDGDSSKWNTVKCVNGSTYKIVEPREAFLQMQQDDVILITSGAYAEIIEEIECYVCNSAKVFVFHLMRKYDKDEKLITVGKTETIIGKSNTLQIPKVIHYCWFGGKTVPQEFQRNIESWREFCPDYKIIQWDESKCNIDENKYARQAYDKRKWGFVPDYFRLKILHEYGGVYLDLDVEVLKPLDELLYTSAYACFEDNEYVNLGSGFGAVPHHPLIKALLKSYDNISFLKNDNSINLTASPVYQTEILKDHGLVCNGEMQIIGGMTILPMDYLCAQSSRTGFNYITKNTFSIHHFAGSWLPKKRAEDGRIAQTLLKQMIYL